MGGLCEGASILSLSCRSRTLIRARAAASLRFSFKPACHLTSLSHPQFHALPAGWLAYYTANILSLSCRLLCRPAISCPALPTMNSNGMGTKVNCPRTYLPHPPMSDSIAIYSANAFVWPLRVTLLVYTLPMPLLLWFISSSLHAWWQPACVFCELGFYYRVSGMPPLFRVGAHWDT